MNLSVWLVVRSSLQCNNFMFSFIIQNCMLVFKNKMHSIWKKDLSKKVPKNSQSAGFCLHDVTSHRGPWVFVVVCYCSFLIQFTQLRNCFQTASVLGNLINKGSGMHRYVEKHVMWSHSITLFSSLVFPIFSQLHRNITMLNYVMAMMKFFSESLRYSFNFFNRYSFYFQAKYFMLLFPQLQSGSIENSCPMGS